MNKLSVDERAEVVTLLVEGNSIRSISRITGRSQNTISRLLLELGQRCERFHDHKVRNLTKTTRLEVDEVFSFVGCKGRHVLTAKKAGQVGDSWTWVAIDAENKLAVSWLVGGRDGGTADAFLQDVRSRLSQRVQMTTDAYHVYLTAVEKAFGWNGLDYAMLTKVYGKASKANEGRYSPPPCIGVQKKWVMGEPVRDLVSTSYVERSNLTLRMHCRRFTRLTNAFSKKLEFHVAAVALHYTYYNFCRIHQTLKITPAMAAGVTPHKWSVEELVMLLDVESLAA